MVTDPAFTEAFWADPAAAVSAAGLTVDPKVLELPSMVDRAVLDRGLLDVRADLAPFLALENPLAIGGALALGMALGWAASEYYHHHHADPHPAPAEPHH
ncbi:hypothetical protein D7223_04805 [Micromonospora endolithica]|uniref:Uncharacterized protein n=2 Tax=Micromonospora endolithica TaxID=230091 RepID=A0A3A9ZUE5_9ACTN|nr:hypothetical protein D7223_04805 [Micromonospora endolithica]